MASDPPATDRNGAAGAEPSSSLGQRWPGTVGRAAFAVAVIATALFGIDLATRPPCPERYVRLLDVEALLPVVTGLLAVGGFAVHRVSRQPGVHRLAGLVGGSLLALALLAGGGAAAWIVSHRSPDWNSSSECWTF